MFNSLHPQIKEHAFKEMPYEACGLILNAESPEYVPCENKADDPKSHFVIDPELGSRYLGKELCAIVHSHPNSIPVPSKTDMKVQLEMGVPFGVLSVNAMGCSDIYYWGKGARKHNLLARPYVWGIYDCLTLCLDYYNEKFNLYIPDTPREFDKTDGREVIRIGKECGFSKVNEPPREHDAIIFRNGHCGIYLGSDRLLHHPTGDKPYDPTRLSHEGCLSSAVYEYEVWRYVS